MESIKNRYFSIYNSLKNHNNNNSLKLIAEVNELYLNVPLPHPLCIEIIFHIKIKNKDINVSIRELNLLINQQNKTITDDIQKLKTIKDWIIPDGNIKFSLLFKMSRDGSKCSDFQ